MAGLLSWKTQLVTQIAVLSDPVSSDGEPKTYIYLEAPGAEISASVRFAREDSRI